MLKRRVGQWGQSSRLLALVNKRQPQVQFTKKIRFQVLRPLHGAGVSVVWPGAWRHLQEERCLCGDAEHHKHPEEEAVNKLGHHSPLRLRKFMVKILAPSPEAHVAVSMATALTARTREGLHFGVGDGEDVGVAAVDDAAVLGGVSAQRALGALRQVVGVELGGPLDHERVAALRLVLLRVDVGRNDGHHQRDGHHHHGEREQHPWQQRSKVKSAYLYI